MTDADEAVKLAIIEALREELAICHPDLKGEGDEAWLFVGGTPQSSRIALDLDGLASAAMTALPVPHPPTPIGDREAVARIVDPDAWAYFDTDAGQHHDADLLRFSTWKQSSLTKADAILALTAPAGGETELRKSDGPEIRNALRAALAFLDGFEGDEMQEGIDERIDTVRSALKVAEKLS